MFYENPSTRTMLDGFMSKKGRSFEEFDGLFGFDKMSQGIPYEMLQACTLIYVDECTEFVNRTGMTVSGYNIYLDIMDNNNAWIHIDFDYSTSMDFKFNYRVDNFPSIEIGINILDKRHIRRSVDIDFSTSIPREIMSEAIYAIVSFLTMLLWKTYCNRKERNYEND